MESIWNNNIDRLKFSQLQGDIKTDVLIIGGGICGVLCAYILKKAGIDCVLAEADKICGGITNSTTAKITFQHGLVYDKIISKYGTEKAYLYFESQRNALEKLTKIASEIEDDLEICDSFVYSLKDREVIEKEVKSLADWLDKKVFDGMKRETLMPNKKSADGFNKFFELYKSGLGAFVSSGMVDHDGGELLVRQTIQNINNMFEKN